MGRCGSYIHVSCSKVERIVYLRFSITVHSTCMTTDCGALVTNLKDPHKTVAPFKNPFHCYRIRQLVAFETLSEDRCDVKECANLNKLMRKLMMREHKSSCI